MSDRELLEKAAKAAGYTVACSEAEMHGCLNESTIYRGLMLAGIQKAWNPLDDDGDALRLAVACGLVVDTSRPSAGEPFKPHWCAQEDFADRGAATRRAIVRAAAAVQAPGAAPEAQP